MDNGTQVSIASNIATFIFPDNVPHEFFLDSMVEQHISFKLVISQNICLQITYGKPSGFTPEKSVAAVMA